MESSGDTLTACMDGSATQAKAGADIPSSRHVPTAIATPADIRPAAEALRESFAAGRHAVPGLPAAAREALTALSSQLDLPLHRIGQMHADGTAGRIDLLDAQQQPIDLASIRQGYDHFA